MIRPLVFCSFLTFLWSILSPKLKRPESTQHLNYPPWLTSRETLTSSSSLLSNDCGKKSASKYSAVQINVGKGCLSAVLVHATFDYVYLDIRVRRRCVSGRLGRLIFLSPLSKQRGRSKEISPASSLILQGVFRLFCKSFGCVIG